MEKPNKPIEPKLKDYYPSDSIRVPHCPDFDRDYKKYLKETEKYEKLLEETEQKKLIRFVKNANEKLILRKYKIIKL